MAFKMTGKCRKYFQHIYDKEDKKGKKLKYLFDEYYFCLMAGLAAEKYDENPKWEPSDFTDNYPGDYVQSRDYIAGLLIATERKMRGLPESDSGALEKLMMEYLDPESRTRLNEKGVERLNQYAAYGIDLIMDIISQPYELEPFLIEYLDCFEKGKFLVQE